MILIGLSLVAGLAGCGDGDRADYYDNSESAVATVATNIDSQLSKTSTGQAALQTLTGIRRSGYSVNYTLATSQEILQMNGHAGGGYRISGNSILIYINSGLAINEQAHVVAHEVVHIQDDLDIDKFLRNYPYVKAAAEDFVRNYSARGIGQFDDRAIEYVLGTLFCTEARAYSRNQQMANDGMPTSYFAKGPTLASFIDNTYIAKFGTNYAANSSAMLNWCLAKSSMTSIQSYLVW